jgi:hypothetical protein
MSLSRRSLVTSAAALPALALPVVAMAMPASQASTTDPTLLALGEKLKPLWARYAKLRPVTRRLYEQCSEAAGWDQLGRDRTKAQQEAAMRLFRRAFRTTGYSRMMDIINTLDIQMKELGHAILEIPSTDRVGDAIHLAAILVMNTDQDCTYKYRLWEITAHAGFAVPEDEYEA